MALWDETSGHNGCVLFVVVGIFLFHNIHVCYQKIGSCESGFIKMSFCRKGAALHHKRQQLTSVFDHREWGREANLSLDVCFFLENWKKAIVCVALLTGCGKSDKDGKSAWLCHTGRGGRLWPLWRASPNHPLCRENSYSDKLGFTYLFIWEPIVLMICKSANFFLYGSILGYFNKSGLTFAGVGSLLTGDFLWHQRCDSVWVMSTSHLERSWHSESIFASLQSWQFCA